MVLVCLDENSFLMGNEISKYEDERPVREIKLNKFYISKYETTYEDWILIYDWAITNGYDFSGEGQNGSDTYWRSLEDSYNYPVVNINWYDAIKWCNALSEYNNLMPCYYTDSLKKNVYKAGEINIGSSFVNWNCNGFRLPTEAEWEYACRGGKLNYEYFWGYDYSLAYEYANISDKSAKSIMKNWKIIDIDDGFSGISKIGSLKANGYGLYDMTGNVWEWCFDIYGKYRKNVTLNPKGATRGHLRVFRGSSFENYGIDNLRIAKRMSEYPYFKDVYLGFRVVKSKN